MNKTFKFEEFGYEVEIGKFAKQADGSAWFKQSGTIVLATVCSSPLDTFPGFLPLTIDYRELLSAAGKIPGGYYKREGKSTENEVLISRLIDRAVRPLFPANYFDQVQILSTVYSADHEHVSSTLALIASSVALTISKIPFLEPIGAVEIGRIDNKWVVNPSITQRTESGVRLTIAGTIDGICMVEGFANQISETEFIDALMVAHEPIKRIVKWQLEIKNEMGVPKEQSKDNYKWSFWESKVTEFISPSIVAQAYIADKIERNTYMDSIRDTFIEENKAIIEETKVPHSVINYMFDVVFKEKITDHIFVINKRIDGRDFNQVRPISVEVGLLPCAHGSALFTRGRTQALVSATLGGGQDEQRFDSLMEESTVDGSFMLHYNFPPFSVGEVKQMRGPGRREIGHGSLAASAFRFIRPTKEEFPYTIRIVADMLESDGSTSMATSCGATMALMQAGVPIKSMVGGVAMGLLKNKNGQFKVLTDISGFEDAFGLMDFKVVGTDKGITAIQMDIKYKGGLTKEIFEAALTQAKAGRFHILGEMRKVMTKPNEELSPLVPKITTLKIDPERIGAVIGKGGSTIREITEKTKTTIDVEPDGLVKIFGAIGSDAQFAVNWIKVLTGQITPRDVYQGIVKRAADFGLFVELVPGVQGLVHISAIPREKQKTFMHEYKPESKVKVEVLDFDPVSNRISLKIIG